MISLLHYQLINYLRTYKYIPPFFIFILCMVVNYAFVPNPILDSFSFTSTLLFLLMGWFTVTIFHAEDEGQKVITILHSKGQKPYFWALYLICIAIGFCLSWVSVMYPIMIDAFGERPRPVHIVLGFLAHFSLSILAIGLSALFTRELVKNKQNSWWGVLSMLIISIAIVSLKNEIKGLIWLFPPVHLSLEMMSSEDSLQSIPAVFYWQFIWIFVYSLLVIWLYFFILTRKKKM
ncbi:MULTISPECIES: ABC transporter permease [unclassified Lysinibacillus]|uniref:ABC transporter permease n=1 Tax=unclassified Lysinibacillus TaxID=2636778 RepID=UPI0038264BBC